MIDNCESFLSKHNGKLSAEYGTFVSLSSFFSSFQLLKVFTFLQMILIYIVLIFALHGWIREQPKNSKLLSKNT